MNAPISIIIVCMKSVHITAVSPPVMVKSAATASKIKIETYRPPSPVSPIACLMNIAPENKSAYEIRPRFKLERLKFCYSCTYWNLRENVEQKSKNW